MTANTSQSRVTLDEVRHIADLGNLRLTADEEMVMQRDLNAILTYVAQLNELDTAAVTPMAQVSEMLASSFDADDSRETLRQDQLRPSLERAAVMTGAPETDGIFFKVPKVIDR